MTWLLVAALLATPKLPHGQRPKAPAPAPVEQLTPDQVRDRVDTYLGSIDRPITAEMWRGLGPQAAQVLEPIVTDAQAMPSRRARALEGLVAAAPDRAAQVVGPIARDEREPVALRVAAVRGAARVLPPAKALSELKPVLRSAKSAGLRGTAADALSRRKGGCAAVREQAAREDADSREAYRDALSRCKEP